MRSRIFLFVMFGAEVSLWMLGGCRMASADRERLVRIKAAAEHELFENVLPFWRAHSIDREYGGYLTCLDREGRPYDTFKQVWMQWREVWMFALLSQHPRGGSDGMAMGWSLTPWKKNVYNFAAVGW